MTARGRPAWVGDDLFPFESRFVELDGHVVHYIDEGSGPTLLRKPIAEEMAHYRNALATRNRRDASAVFARRITASRAFLADVKARLPTLASLPALIVWGNADVAFGNKERQRWEHIFTDHHTVIVDGAGHFVQSDAPEEFAAAICDWRTPPTGRARLTSRGDGQT